MSYSLTEYFNLVQQGKRGSAQFREEHIFGSNPAVPNGTWETVSDLGDMYFPTVATTVKIKAGGDAADTAAGLGAQEVTVYGLDETGALAQEAIATAGASSSASTTTTFIRLFKAEVTAVGTYAAALGGTGSNTDDIIIEITAGSQDWIQIEAEHGISEFASYTVPLGWIGYLMEITIHVDASKTADVVMDERCNALDVTTPFASKRSIFHFNGILGDLDRGGLDEPLRKIPALTDIWFEAKGGGAITEANVDFDIHLFKVSS